jgi:rhamnogalacturonan acetylesterase
MPSLLRILVTALIFIPSANAQIKTPDAPPQTAVPKDAPLNPALPTVFIVGDSTARNRADLGWGDHFAPLFDTAKINVANRAIAGRSSRTYIIEGHWDKVLAEMKPGDFVLIQMGHNDGGASAQTIGNDPKYRGSIKGVGDETADLPIKTPYTTGPLAGKTVETVHTYGWYIRKYIADARAKGATPILLTPTIRNIWTDGKIERDMGFRDFDMQTAAAEHVPLADMASIEADTFEQFGQTKVAHLFPIDHTHTSAEGAVYAAMSVGEALRQSHSPLMAFLLARPDTIVELWHAMSIDGGEDANHARFLADRPQMEIFAKEVLSKIASGHPSTSADITRIPPGVTQISVGDKVLTSPNGKPHFVLFVTFYGILNSFAGYVYSESGNAPHKDAFTGSGFEIAKIAPHWFWYSSRN